MDKSQERIRSAQAGILGALCLGLVYLLLSGANLAIERMGWIDLPLDLISVEGLFDLLSVGITGFLFGVTYRYIIRGEQNLQLKAGGILAFALVRAIAQIDTGLQLQSLPGSVWLLAGESLVLFGIGGGLMNTFLTSTKSTRDLNNTSSKALDNTEQALSNREKLTVARAIKGPVLLPDEVYSRVLLRARERAAIERIRYELVVLLPARDYESLGSRMYSDFSSRCLPLMNTYDAVYIFGSNKKQVYQKHRDLLLLFSPRVNNIYPSEDTPETPSQISDLPALEIDYRAETAMYTLPPDYQERVLEFLSVLREDGLPEPSILKTTKELHHLVALDETEVRLIISIHDDRVVVHDLFMADRLDLFSEKSKIS